MTNWVKSGYVPVGDYVRAPISEDEFIVLKPGVDFRAPEDVGEWEGPPSAFQFGHGPLPRLEAERDD